MCEHIILQVDKINEQINTVYLSENFVKTFVFRSKIELGSDVILFFCPTKLACTAAWFRLSFVLLGKFNRPCGYIHRILYWQSGDTEEKIRPGSLIAGVVFASICMYERAILCVGTEKIADINVCQNLLEMRARENETHLNGTTNTGNQTDINGLPRFFRSC